MPTTDATNSGFTPIPDPAQDVNPNLQAEQEQKPEFDFSLDLPDSFSASQPVETSVPQTADQPVEMPSIETTNQAPEAPSMNFLLEDTPSVSEPQFQTEVSSVSGEESQVSASLPASESSFLTTTPEETVNPLLEEEKNLVESGSLNFSSSVDEFPLPTVNENTSESSSAASNIPQESSSNPMTSDAVMDPFEAMRASLQPQETVPEVQNAPVHGDLNLDQPLSPETVPTSASFETVDPVMQETMESPVLPQAMQTPEIPQVNQIPVVEPIVEMKEPASQLLSLDEMIAQPVQVSAPVEQAVPVATSSTMNLDNLASIGANSMMGSIPVVPIAQPVSRAGYGKVVAAAMIGVLVLAVGLMAYMKYPDKLSELLGGSTTLPQQPTEVAILSGENEHSSAELTGEQLELTGDLQEAELTGEVVLEESEIVSDDSIQEVVLGDADTTEDVVLGDDPQEETTRLPGEGEATDALSAVEDIVGTVGTKDVLDKTIEEYRADAQKMADEGKANNDRLATKWGYYVAKEVEKLQKEIENGKNITISEWTTIKVKLDADLAKAKNDSN